MTFLAYLFISCYSLPEWKLLAGRDLAPLTGVLLCLEQYLAQRECSINIYKMTHEIFSFRYRTQKRQSGLASGPGWTWSKVTAEAGPQGGSLGSSPGFAANTLCGFRQFGNKSSKPQSPPVLNGSWYLTNKKGVRISWGHGHTSASWKVDPFLALKKESDLAPLFFLDKDMCPVNSICLPLAQESNVGFFVVIVVVSSFEEAFCGWMWRHLALFWGWFLILSSLVYVVFFYFVVMW